MLAKEAQRDAQVALELAPDNDVAHHLSGRYAPLQLLRSAAACHLH